MLLNQKMEDESNIPVIIANRFLLAIPTDPFCMRCEVRDFVTAS